MKYTILDAHIKYFQENGLIDFEDLLSIQMLDKINNFFKKRPNNISSNTYNKQRDLFRTSEIFKKIAFNKTVTSILKTLTKNKNLRLAFDQLILRGQNTPFNDTFSLNQICSFQGLIGAVIINIDPNILNIKNLNKKNNSIFINNCIPINIQNTFLDSNVFLIIGYGEFKTLYKYNTKDPNTHYLKQFGYNFGDLLKDSLHPVVF